MQTTLEAPKKNTTLWPYAIIATFVLFGLFIGYMVKQAMSTSVDLVSKDYYEKEIAYQQQMDTEARTASLASAITVQHQSDAQQLLITLPATFTGQAISGTAHFFRPSDKNLDFEVPLQPDTQLQQRLNTAKMQPGHWRVRLSFTANNQQYYTEQQVTIR